jgi:hypothetical protein
MGFDEKIGAWDDGHRWWHEHIPGLLCLALSLILLDGCYWAYKREMEKSAQVDALTSEVKKLKEQTTELWRAVERSKPTPIVSKSLPPRPFFARQPSIVIQQPMFRQRNLQHVIIQQQLIRRRQRQNIFIQPIVSRPSPLIYQTSDLGCGGF